MSIRKQNDKSVFKIDTIIENCIEESKEHTEEESVKLSESMTIQFENQLDQGPDEANQINIKQFNQQL